ncbi:DnaJ -like protein subfamily C member 1 [Halotydeus destructor]|nr:DnaJ -like protein subfamily C member 1 [Halotydeus destructor]
MLVLKLCVLFVTGVTVGRAWFDEEQLELFDLVEEVKDNFYEFMELNQTATTSDIKRAFRQLSLRLHPDKNDEPDAEIKFRHLVSISDVLRDESKRKKYDEILVNGLPNWRSGMYYIRRARKLGLLEMSIIVSVILTLGHYLCLVAAYYEKLFEVNEVLRRKEKKLKQSDYDVLYQETLDSNGIRKPKMLHDNLPVKTVLGVFYLIVHYIPSAIRSTIEKRNERRRLLEEEAEEKAYLEQQSQAEANRPKRVRAKIELPEYSDETPFVLNSAIKSEKSKDDLKIKRGIWSDDGSTPAG